MITDETKVTELKPIAKSLITTEGLDDFIVDTETVQAVVTFLTALLGLQEFELDISFVKPQDIQETNRTFRQKNQPTDVLSFPQQTWVRKVSLQKPYEDQDEGASEITYKTLGDLVICPAVARESANQIGQSLAVEICFLLIHGILHLCGYDHGNAADEVEMLAQQRAMMKHLKASEHWSAWTHALVKPIT